MGPRGPRDLARGHGRLLCERGAPRGLGPRRQARRGRREPERREGSRRRDGVQLRGPRAGDPERHARLHRLAQGSRRGVPAAELRPVRVRLRERDERAARLRRCPRAREHRRGLPRYLVEGLGIRWGRRVRQAREGRSPGGGGPRVHIGAAPNKSTAKIASDLAKPDGIKLVRPEEVGDFLAPLPVTRISGVGPKTATVLEHAGIRMIGDLARFPGAELKRLLGKNAVWLWGIARGLEQLPVEERPDPKSISVERTFERDVSEWFVVLETLDDIARNVHLRARAQGATFRTAGIKIRFEGFRTHLRERSLGSHILDEDALKKVARDLIREFEAPGRKVRLLGVRVANLERPKAKQPTLAAFGVRDGA